MRILVVAPGGAGARIAGPEIRSWSLAEAFAARHQVTVALRDPPSDRRGELRMVRSTRATVIGEARRHDAVVAPTIPPYLYAALRGADTITVSDQYDPVALEMSVFADEPGIDRVIRSQLRVREVQLRYSDVVACAGEAQRRLLLEELAQIGASEAPTVVSVPFGLPEAPPPSTERPLRAQYPQFGAGDPIVLWWGKLWGWFDGEAAVRAFALVVQRRPDARLVISAGRSPQARFDRSDRTDATRALSRELGLLDRNVFFLDEWTPYDRRQDYLRDADLGVTMHADTAEAPFAARARYMDYLWCGLPCVLARGDEVADRFGAAGFASLVAPRDHVAAAEAILHLIDQPHERAAACEAGLRLAEDYRWPTLVEPLTRAIEQRVTQRRRRQSRRLGRAVGRYYAHRTVDHALALARSTPR